MSRRRAIGAPLAAGLVVAAYAASLRRYGVFDPVDEGLLLVQALRTAHGQVPYLDFHTGYGPLYFRFQALLLLAGGWAAIRWALVAVHGATAALTFILARRLTGPLLAWVAIALEVSFFLPVAPGRGAPFNVPYPAWYAGLAGVALAVLLGAKTVGPWHAALAGFIAGVTAAMKPNSGVLLLAGAAAALVLGDGPGGKWLSRGVLALIVLAAVAMVSPTGLTMASWVLVPPVVALATLGSRRSVAHATVLGRLAPLAGGFVAVVATVFVPSLIVLGPAGLVREIGGKVASLYALPFPWPAGVAGAVGLVAFVLAGKGRVALRIAGLGTLALAFADGATEARASLVALRLGAEEATFALVPLVLWGSLAARARGRDAGLAASTAIAALAALQLYPRPDAIHLMPLGPLLLPLALFLWRAGARRLALPAMVLVGVPLVVAAGRFAPTVPVLARLATGRVAEVTLGSTPLEIEPENAAPLGGLAAAVDAVRAISPEESVLVFPACSLVPFLADRLPAGSYDYFFPGRPDRAAVAALARHLTLSPPRMAVTCAAEGTALAAAWQAYPELTELLASGYRERLPGAQFSIHDRRD